jgi:hypothetical protein
MNSHKKRACFDELHKKIHAFIKFNPSFGKRKVKMTQLNPFSHIQTCSYYYESKSLPLLSNLDIKKDNMIFMKSHLDESDDDDDDESSSSSEEEEMNFDSEDGNQTPILEDEDDEDDNIPRIEPIVEEYDNYISYFFN